MEEAIFHRDLEMKSWQRLSKRVGILNNGEDFLLKYLDICNANEHHEESNRHGYINLGIAVNNLCDDILYPKVTDSTVWSCDTALLHYKESHGILRLRKALATIMTETLKAHEPVNPDNLFCTVGATSSLDLIAHCLADPGDVIMTPTPAYGRLYTDIFQRSLVEMWPIPMITKDSDDETSELTLDMVKNAYLEATQQGKNVRGILLVNPNNPLGNIYSCELLMSILEFCHEANLNAVVDEVYANTVFGEGTKFHSVLSFSKLPDPASTHVIYGLSKNFAMAGLRIGVIHTTNPELQKCLLQLAIFQVIPYPVMDIAARVLEDLEFCRSFIATSKQRLCEQFKYCKGRLEKMGVPVFDTSAAFFLWISLKEKCQITTFEEELSFFRYLMKFYHLYIVPGKQFFCAQPGYFRITFTRKPDLVAKGIDRLEEAINNFSKKHSSNFQHSYSTSIESEEHF